MAIQASQPAIVLNDLENGLPGLSKKTGAFLAEASAFCLEHKDHTSGVCLYITGEQETYVQVYWNNVMTEDILHSWDDLQEATEYGASGIAILLMVTMTPYTIIRRARKGSNVDYWLGYKESDHPLQNAARLEVSGILATDSSQAMKARIVQKRVQVHRSDNRTPVFIVIVAFSGPTAHMEQIIMEKSNE